MSYSTFNAIDCTLSNWASLSTLSTSCTSCKNNVQSSMMSSRFVAPSACTTALPRNTSIAMQNLLIRRLSCSKYPGIDVISTWRLLGAPAGFELICVPECSPCSSHSIVCMKFIDMFRGSLCTSVLQFRLRSRFGCASSSRIQTCAFQNLHSHASYLHCHDSCGTSCIGACHLHLHRNAQWRDRVFAPLLCFDSISPRTNPAYNVDMFGDICIVPAECANVQSSGLPCQHTNRCVLANVRIWDGSRSWSPWRSTDPIRRQDQRSSSHPAQTSLHTSTHAHARSWRTHPPRASELETSASHHSMSAEPHACARCCCPSHQPTRPWGVHCRTSSTHCRRMSKKRASQACSTCGAQCASSRAPQSNMEATRSGHFIPCFSVSCDLCLV